MITYEQVKKAMIHPPPELMIDLFNDIGKTVSNHPGCINESNPFNFLKESGKFCISATSIQSDYIAFVMGKHKDSEFPTDVMKMFFDLDNQFKVQFAKIQGKEIDGCIYLIHRTGRKYDLQNVYDNIYA